MSALLASAYPYDVASFIGRCQGFHNAHLAMIQEGLALAPKVVVALGSAFQARSPKNPFVWTEVADMIRMSLPEADRSRVVIVPVRDYYDDHDWVAEVQALVTKEAPEAGRIALVGHFKDASSYYLNRFPGWALEERGRQFDVDGTGVRNVLFAPDASPATLHAKLDGLVPAAVIEFLGTWSKLPCRAQLAWEAEWLKGYKEKWGHIEESHAGDAIVVCCGHVLLIQRGEGAGKGLYAVPGGFVEPGEDFLVAALRELVEETDLEIPPSWLRQFLCDSAEFAHPNRSPRGRIISHAYFFKLGGIALPPVSSAGDPDGGARRAVWVPIAELAAMENMFFEDHFLILDRFLDILGRRRIGKA